MTRQSIPECWSSAGDHLHYRPNGTRSDRPPGAAGGVQVFEMGEQQVDLALTMHKLKELGVHRLLVEGGGTLNESLMRLRLVDEISIYVAPLIFGGMNTPTFASGVGLLQQEAIRLQLIDINKLGDGGILLRYLPLYG